MKLVVVKSNFQALLAPNYSAFQITVIYVMALSRNIALKNHETSHSGIGWASATFYNNLLRSSFRDYEILIY